VASIAPSAQVIEVEAQVRALINGHLMVCVQMPLASCECSAKLLQHFVTRRNTEADLAAPLHDVRLPAAVHASPAVALKAQHPQPAMIRTVSTLGAISPGVIVSPSRLRLMVGATRGGADKAKTAWMSAWVLDCCWHLFCPGSISSQAGVSPFAILKGWANWRTDLIFALARGAANWINRALGVSSRRVLRSKTVRRMTTRRAPGSLDHLSNSLDRLLDPKMKVAVLCSGLAAYRFRFNAVV